MTARVAAGLRASWLRERETGRQGRPALREVGEANRAKDRKNEFMIKEVVAGPSGRDGPRRNRHGYGNSRAPCAPAQGYNRLFRPAPGGAGFVTSKTMTERQLPAAGRR